VHEHTLGSGSLTVAVCVPFLSHAPNRPSGGWLPGFGSQPPVKLYCVVPQVHEISSLQDPSPPRPTAIIGVVQPAPEASSMAASATEPSAEVAASAVEASDVASTVPNGSRVVAASRNAVESSPAISVRAPQAAVAANTMNERNRGARMSLHGLTRGRLDHNKRGGFLRFGLPRFESPLWFLVVPVGLWRRSEQRREKANRRQSTQWANVDTEALDWQADA